MPHLVARARRRLGGAATLLLLAALAGCDGSRAAPTLSDLDAGRRNAVVDLEMATRFGLPLGAPLGGSSGARRSLSAGSGDGGGEAATFGFEELCSFCMVTAAAPYRDAIGFEAVTLPGGWEGGGYVDPRRGALTPRAVYNGFGMDRLTLRLASPLVFHGVWVANYQDVREFWIEGYRDSVLVGTTPRITLTSEFQYLAADFGGAVDRLVLRRTDSGRVYLPVTAFTAGWYYVDDFSFGPPRPREPVDLLPPADSSAPIITARVQGVPGADGWYVSNVAVAWAVEDAESPIGSTSGCDELRVMEDTEGSTFTCTATSRGGTSTHSVTIRRDTSHPVLAAEIEGTLANGWYSSRVRVSWTATDGGLTLAPPCAPATLDADTRGETYRCSAADRAGLSSDTAITIRRDATAPEIRFSAHPASYTVDQRIDIRCTATDALSGIADARCDDLAADAHTLTGTRTLTARATDLAGNVGTGVTTFAVRVTDGGVCALAERWITKPGIANSLCAKLRNAAAADARGSLGAKSGMLDAFVREVQAQTGKSITAEHAASLIRLAGQL